MLLSLGTVGYEPALRLQQELVRLRQENAIPDTLVLLEHPPVITLGRNANRSHLLVSEQELERRGVAMYKVERGGDITFHGPGQLVGYPVFRLGDRLLGVRRFVELLEQALVRSLAQLGVYATVRPGFVGVWTGGGDNTGATGVWRKIASIGIAVKRGVTMHGFALNVTTDLSWFRLMNPCGLSQVVMTSVQEERGKTDPLEVREVVAKALAEVLGVRFQTNLPRSLTSLTKGLAMAAISSASLSE